MQESTKKKKFNFQGKQISNLTELALVNESLCAKHMYLLTRILIFLFLCENDYVDINCFLLRLRVILENKVQLLYSIKLNVIDHI